MPFKIRVYLILLCSIVFFGVPSKLSYAYQQTDKGNIEVLKDILSKPDSQIDLALYPKSLEMQLGDKGAKPHELSVLSDWGSRVQSTTLQFQG